MNTIELRKCYEEYEWRNCLISNRDVKLFDSQYDAIGYLDKDRELYVQTPSSWDLKDCEGKRVTPNRWLRVETKNDNYGVVTLRENWGLGELKDIVAYRRDKTYLDLMTEKDKNLLLDVIQRVVTDDSWREILVFGIDDSDGVYPVDIDIYPSEVKSLGIDEWVRENLYIRYEFSHFSPYLGYSDFKFRINDDYVSADWRFCE